MNHEFDQQMSSFLMLPELAIRMVLKFSTGINKVSYKIQYRIRMVKWIFLEGVGAAVE